MLQSWGIPITPGMKRFIDQAVANYATAHLERVEADATEQAAWQKHQDASATVNRLKAVEDEAALSLLAAVAEANR